MECSKSYLHRGSLWNHVHRIRIKNSDNGGGDDEIGDAAVLTEANKKDMINKHGQ